MNSTSSTASFAHRWFHSQRILKPAQEKARRFIVNLVFLVYMLLIFEGALRKWIFPEYEKFFFFIRDPFVAIIYVYAAVFGLCPWRHRLFWLSMILAAFFGGLGAFHIFSQSLHPFVAAYGWRVYCFYLPLAFIIGANFRYSDLMRLMRYTLLLGLPLAVLVFYQYQSLPTDFINQTVRVSSAYTMDQGKAGGRVVRTVGTFTFFHGQNLFVGSLIAFVITAWIMPARHRPMRLPMLILASIAALVHLILSGNRMPYLLAILVIGACLLFVLLSRSTHLKLRAGFFPIILAAVGVMLGGYFFAKACQITSERSSYLEDRGDGVFDRMQDKILLRPLIKIDKAPWWGYGLGFCTPAGNMYDAAGGAYWAGESEWRNNIAETGLIGGGIYILYRLFLVLWLACGAARTAYVANHPLPLMLVAFIGPIIAIWYITRIGTVNGYAWLFVGFCIAANRLSAIALWRHKQGVIP